MDTRVDALRELDALLASVGAPDSATSDDVRRRLDGLTKPPGSLGRVEAVAHRLARIYGDPPPPLHPRTVFVLAGDHGVTAKGVSAYPGEVTAQMCANVLAGGAAINALAGAVDARVVLADIGVDADLSGLDGIEHLKVRRGSRDLSEEPALTREEAVAAILRGAELVHARGEASRVIALGELGIGNTTSASALTAALTGMPIEDAVGPGTGVNGSRLESKRRCVRAALQRLPTGSGPLDLLSQVGGLEIAGLVGVALAAASRERAVLMDGFIATAAALIAVRLQPHLRHYLFASHRSAEPAHEALLNELELSPLLTLDLRLGEGTGAVLALPILDAAAAILREMATFSSARVSESNLEPGEGA